jgi:hypothetical protein
MKKHNKTTAILEVIGLILTINIFVFVLGCDLAKPQNPSPSYQNRETTSTVTEDTQSAKDENNVQSADEADKVQPAKEIVQNETADTSIKLDQTFEDKGFGVRFNYPSTLTLERNGFGEPRIWFSKQKIDQEMIIMSVTGVTGNQKHYLSQTKAQITQDVKKTGSSLKFFEKIKLDNQDCVHIKIAFGGMFDPRGNRISEQYILKNLMINFSAPAKEFETYRPQFMAILNTFKIDE